MLEPLEIAKLYFNLSNKSNFSGIEKLLTDSTTYSSPTTGIYLGKTDIITMQKEFHSKFSSLQWTVNSFKKIKPGVVLADYEFIGKMVSGEKVNSYGLEYVIVYNNKIQHIEIKNK